MLSSQLREFYCTSPMREGVLCWYPFKQGSIVLDQSGGVLSELLSSKPVYPTQDSDRLVDYIIALDPEDFSEKTLSELRGKLSSHGRLLIAYENPFALRYWAGASAPNTGAPYDTLLGNGDSPAPSKAELENRLMQAGFNGQKWYYLSPDHWFTGEVHSDNYMPNELMNQRLIPYIADDKNLQFDERQLHREVIRGGAFSFMCGAYLVEARVCGDDEPCIVNYAAVTSFRDTVNRFATIVSNDGTVRKTPLHEDAISSVKKTHENHEDLAKLGVSVVKTRLENDSLIMSFVDLPTIWDYWALKLLVGHFDENEMISHFDRMREDIYKASKNGRCYWEMVPANCFYDEKTDEMTYFDQEHYWEDASPDVAVARALWALRYSEVFAADNRSEKLLETLKRRYGIADKWDELSYLAHNKTLEMLFFKGESQLRQETENALKTIASNTCVRDSSVT